jgi:uncharacterized membrane protein SpoIIM required for sporulation
VETFYPFVIGHGAFELTAITFAGAGGLKLGYALLAPGRRSRRLALLETTRASMPLVYGMTFMLLLAAFLEAFWSSGALVDPQSKLWVGALFWLLVLIYFVLGGRHGSR